MHMILKVSRSGFANSNLEPSKQKCVFKVFLTSLPNTQIYNETLFINCVAYKRLIIGTILTYNGKIHTPFVNMGYCKIGWGSSDMTILLKKNQILNAWFISESTIFDIGSNVIGTCGYILGVLMHTTTSDRHWRGENTEMCFWCLNIQCSQLLF